jgi:hypothetical protein
MTLRDVEVQTLGQLRLRFTRDDDPELAKRRARLRQIFNGISDHAAATVLYSRLIALLPRDELSREFHERLHTATRQELLDILARKVRTPPAAKTPPKPQPPPPKEPDLKGRKLAESMPVHPNAWNDIAILDLVREDLPDAYIITDSTYNEVFDDEVPLVGDIKLKYKFIPMVDDIDGKPHVLYYTVYNVKANRVEYAVGPALLPKFRELLPGSFGLAGIASWYFHFGGHQREYQRQLGRAAHYAHRGEWLRTGDSLGKVYSKAAKDPRYWIDMILATLGAYAMSGAKPTGGGPPSGSAGAGSAALKRLQETSTNLIDAQVQRSTTVLTEPHVFRHSIASEFPAVNFARIEAEASMRLSEGINATYGRGVYAWPSQTPRGGIYIDIQVPAGVAVETIVHPTHGTFYRIIGASGDTVPVRIVNTNLSTDEILMGRELLKGRD